LAVAVTIPGSAFAMLEPEERSEIERMYVEGQDRYVEGDYVGAAQQWTALLDALPESESNRVARESVLLNAMQAYIDAYRRVRNADGTRNVEHLHGAQRILDDYRGQLRDVHGEEVAAAVQEKADELDGELAAAARLEEGDIGACLQPWCLSPCLEALPQRRGCDGAGGGMAVLGLFALPGVARRRRRDVLAQMSSRLPADVVQRLEAQLDADPEDDEG
jgi:hypothetical protein